MKIQAIKARKKRNTRSCVDVLHLEEEGATELASTATNMRRASNLTFASPIEML
jgi:hypothetical protein